METEIAKLKLQAHNLIGRKMQAELQLMEMPKQKEILVAQIVKSDEDITKIQAQIETLTATTDTAPL